MDKDLIGFYVLIILSTSIIFTYFSINSYNESQTAQAAIAKGYCSERMSNNDVVWSKCKDD